MNVTFRPAPATGDHLRAYGPGHIKGGHWISIILDVVEVTSWCNCQDIAGDAGSVAILIPIRVAARKTQNPASGDIQSPPAVDKGSVIIGVVPVEAGVDHGDPHPLPRDPCSMGISHAQQPCNVLRNVEVIIGHSRGESAGLPIVGTNWEGKFTHQGLKGRLGDSCSLRYRVFRGHQGGTADGHPPLGGNEGLAQHPLDNVSVASDCYRAVWPLGKYLEVKCRTLRRDSGELGRIAQNEMDANDLSHKLPP